MGRTCISLLCLVTVCVHLALGNHTWRITPVKDTLVEMGSTVTLVGISTWEKTMNRSGINWYKDGYLIMQQHSLKYDFQSYGSVLVIHDFMAPDVGQYLFLYSSNSSKHQRVFQLELLSQSLVPWYRRNPQVFGTITGLIFIALMVLALAYYCYNTDVNVNRPLPYHNQSPLPCHLQRNNDANFNGVRLTPGVRMASTSERPKSCRQVRQQSITTLGAISKQSIERLKKTRATRKESMKPLSFVSTHV